MATATNKTPITYNTFREFEHVTRERRRYGKNSVGHKIAQRRAVAIYLAERAARATAFMIRIGSDGKWS
jgi:hypothetical protein